MMHMVLRNRNPWNLSDTLGGLDRELNQLVRNFCGGSGIECGNGWYPAMDVKETGDAYVLTADIPGLKREEIEISVLDNVVTVKGERKQEQEQTQEKVGWHRFERWQGRFERAFRLPRGVNPEKVSARYENGVLTVTLPKPEAAKPKQIEVHVT